MEQTVGQHREESANCRKLYDDSITVIRSLKKASSGIPLQMTTWAEREFLCKERHIAWPGFSPRAYQKLAVARPPCTDSKIKVRQKGRCPWEDTSRWHVWGYHTWLDIGRLPPLFPLRPDIPYDSNVWRWITAPRTYCMPQPPVPPPSEMDGNTYLKFMAQGALFSDQKSTERAVAKIEKELRECKRLKMMSECRAPPLDSQGNILPPQDFNRSRHLTAGRGLQSLCVQPQSVRPATRDCWDWPCPSLQPHYQEAAQRLALRNSSPVYEELVQKYQELAASGRQIANRNTPHKQNTRGANSKVQGDCSEAIGRGPNYVGLQKPLGQRTATSIQILRVQQ